MKNNLFRTQAMNKLASPEQLDRLVVLVSPLEWLAMLALGLLLGVGLIWGVKGEIHITTAGNGILLSPNQIRHVYSTSAGKIMELTVSVGDLVRKGQIIATVAQPDLAFRIGSGKKQLMLLRSQLDEIRIMQQETFARQLEYFDQKKNSTEEHLRRLVQRLQEVQGSLQDYQTLISQGLMARERLQERIDDKNLTEREIDELKGELQRLSYERENSLQNLKKEQIVSENSLLDAVLKTETELNQLELQTYIRSDYSGRVIACLISEGQFISTNTPLLSLIRQQESTLIGVAFFSPSDGKKIKPGMRARVSPATVRTEEYGSMTGLVTEVSEYPVSMAEMQLILQNDALVDTMMRSANGAPFRVNIKLFLAPDTKSGYKWTSSGGPPVAIESGTPCSVSVTTEKFPPLNMVLQLFEKTIFGSAQSG
jgi:HlyD family secretion protein